MLKTRAGTVASGYAGKYRRTWRNRRCQKDRLINCKRARQLRLLVHWYDVRRQLMRSQFDPLGSGGISISHIIVYEEEEEEEEENFI